MEEGRDRVGCLRAQIQLLQMWLEYGNVRTPGARPRIVDWFVLKYRVMVPLRMHRAEPEIVPWLEQIVVRDL